MSFSLPFVSNRTRDEYIFFINGSLSCLSLIKTAKNKNSSQMFVVNDMKREVIPIICTQLPFHRFHWSLIWQRSLISTSTLSDQIILFFIYMKVQATKAKKAK